MSRLIAVIACVCLGGCMMESVDGSQGELMVTSDCVVSGWGTLPAGDDFSGDIHDDGGLAAGSWSHTVPGTYVDHRTLDPHERGHHGEKECDCRGGHYTRGHGAGHAGGGAGHGTGHCEPDTGHKLVGTPDFLYCFFNGGNVGVVSGPATWDGDPTYRFDLTVEADTVQTYDLTVSAADSTVVYAVSGVPDSGELSVHLP